jgi:acyl-CoA thioester hydrolase
MSELTQALNEPVYRFAFTITNAAIDENGHVNNVHYVQWMQDVAVRHYAALGGVPLLQVLSATWVVRSHTIEYLSPAFAGEQIEVRTWVVNLRRVRSLRRYEFIRKSDDRLLVRGETEWVLVAALTGRPLAIPESIAGLFSLLPDEKP